MKRDQWLGYQVFKTRCCCKPVTFYSDITSNILYIRSGSLSPSLSPSHSDRSGTARALQAVVAGAQCAAARHQIKWVDKDAPETNYCTKNNVVTGTLQPPPHRPPSERQLNSSWSWGECCSQPRCYSKHTSRRRCPCRAKGKRFCNKVNFIVAAAASREWGCRLVPHFFHDRQRLCEQWAKWLCHSSGVSWILFKRGTVPVGRGHVINMDINSCFVSISWLA